MSSKTHKALTVKGILVITNWSIGIGHFRAAPSNAQANHQYVVPGGKMEKRIVRLEDGLWRIRTDAGDLSEPERRELKEYFDEIRFPYRFVKGRLCVAGGVGRRSMFEVLDHFYDGRAEVLPF